MVMHARKPQRDGYFEKQSHSYQSSKYSKRDYDRETTSRSYRVRDMSPPSSSGGGNGGMNGSSYRSQSPELDSPSRGGGHGADRDRYIYVSKMRERSYKEKYIDKRDRSREHRDSEHRTNHDRLDRRYKMCVGEKRSGSDDRERERDREMREREKRDQRSSEISFRDGSSFSETKRKNEGSGRDRRDRDRDRDRSDRDRDRDRSERDRSERIARCGDWSEHVSSSGKMYYYNCKTEVSQWEKPKEWIEKERNMSRGEHREKDYREKEREREDRFSSRNSASTYSKHSNSRSDSRIRWPYESGEGVGSSSNSQRKRVDDNAADMDISPGDSTPTSEASYSLTGTPKSAVDHQQLVSATALPSRLSSHPQQSTSSSITASSSTQYHHMHPSSTSQTTSLGGSNCHRKLEGGTSSISGLSTTLDSHHLNSNTTAPPQKLNVVKSLDQLDAQQKSLDQNHHSSAPTSSSIRENALNSPLYNLSHAHGHGMSPLLNHHQPHHGNNVKNVSSSAVPPSISSAVCSTTSNSAYGSLKTVDGSIHHLGQSGSNLNNQTVSSSIVGVTNSSGIIIPGDGPPTPTQDMDISDGGTSSASLSNLQSCVASVTTKGPEISPKLAKYFRADLITHVTNWPAESLEKQAQKCADECHYYGDIQCTKTSAELKCARSLVRITEITATLQEQKIMYLRQQVRRLEELKTQNSFMSDDL